VLKKSANKKPDKTGFWKLGAASMFNYNAACVKLARRYQVGLRSLDRAL